MNDVIGSQSTEERLAEAAAWHAKLTDHTDDQVRAAFETWCALAPENVIAYAELEETSRRAREAADAPPILALRQETLTRLVLPRRRVGAAALVAAAVLGVGAWIVAGRINLNRDPSLGTNMSATRVYQTGVGECLTVRLADGSVAVLNTSTRLRVAYSGKERRLVIEAGEALFEVAKDQPRPFVVSAAGENIIAHGTKFDVRLSPQRLMVALIEGLVSVRREDADDPSEVHLKPNDMFIADGQTASVRAIPDIGQLISWRQGRVFFDNVELEQAAAEMNRYVERPQIIVRPSVAHIRLSGAFRTGRTTDFLDALARGFPVVVVERSEDNVVLGPPRSPY